MLQNGTMHLVFWEEILLAVSTVLSTALMALGLGAMAVVGCFFLRILEEIKAEICSHSHLVIRNCVWLK